MRALLPILLLTSLSFGQEDKTKLIAVTSSYNVNSSLIGGNFYVHQDDVSILFGYKYGYPRSYGSFWKLEEGDQRTVIKRFEVGVSYSTINVDFDKGKLSINPQMTFGFTMKEIYESNKGKSNSTLPNIGGGVMARYNYFVLGVGYESNPNGFFISAGFDLH